MRNFINKLLYVFKSVKPPKKRPKRTPPTDIIYSPAEISTTTSRIVGTALRALIMFMGTFGISAFVADFFALTYNEVYWGGYYVPVGMIAFAALIISAVFGLAAYSRKTALIAFPAFSAAYLGICAIFHGNPFEYIADCVTRIYNFCLYTMISRGYMYFSDYMVKEVYDYSNSAYVSSDKLRLGGVFILTFFIGALIGTSMMKKVRLWLVAPVCIIFLGPTLLYNMSHGTIGFVFSIAFIVATLTVSIYDYRFAGGLERKNEKIRRRLEKREAKKAKRAAIKEEKKALREEADKMLMAALKADMGAKKSRLAQKAVFKAHKLARKNAKKSEKRRLKAEKKQNKQNKKAERAELKKLKSSSKKNAEAKAQLEVKLSSKASLKTEKKALKAENKAKKIASRHRSDLISAAGGIAGIGTAVLALIIAGLPALAINGPFAKIEPVYNKVNIVNYYVTAYLSGNDIDLNDLSAYGIEELTPRKLSFAPLEYEETQMFSVTTTSDNNIYMKGWSADTFDYYSDTWMGADHDKVLLYRQQFGESFTPDSISTSFKKYVYPSTAEITEPDVYKNFSKFGFTMQSVSVFRSSGYSRLMFIPYSMDTSFGLLERRTLDPIMKRYSSYYEGVYSSRFFEAGDSYDSVSYITRMNRDGISAELENAIAYYSASVSAIEKLREADQATIDSGIYEYEMSLQESGISYIGTSIVDRYFNSMTDAEKASFDESINTELSYRDFVTNNYLTSFGSEKITKLAGELYEAAQVDVETDTHQLVLRVINYLKDNCTYTLTPNEELYPGVGSIIDAFIFDVKEGYCSHFATAAAAILREMGIPTRFVEGYIATDFAEQYGDYKASVLDSNAHAWIEVYYDGMGWIPYETTPAYYDDMYNPDSATIEPVDPNSPDTPVTPPPAGENDFEFDDYEDDYEEELTEIEKFIIVISSVAAAVLLYFVVRLLVKRFIRRGVNMLADRYDLIRRARDLDVWNDPKTDKHSMARKINDQIFDILEVIGAAPEKGELSSAYGKRISDTYGDLSKISAEEIFNIIQKEEFGHGLTFEENAILAEYLADITASVYAGLNRFQKIKYRYIKRKI